MSTLKRRQYALIDLRSRSSSDLSVQSKDRTWYPAYTALNRTPEEFEILRDRLSSNSDSRVRVLQVGIGDDLVGETLSLLDMLHKTGKEYELVCMDPDQNVLLGHALQSNFELKADTLLSCGFDVTTARKILREIQVIRNIRETHEDSLDDGISLLEMAMFGFDVLQSVLDRITYVLGDISKDRLPIEMQGFHAVVCFHTLYHLEQDPRLIVEALRNMASYLVNGGCLAIDTARFDVYRLLTPELVQELGLNPVYESKKDAKNPLIENPRIYQHISSL